MTADDLAVVVRGMTPVVREYVDAQVAPLLKHIATLEQRLAVAEVRPMIPGPAGEDAEPVDVDDVVDAAVEKIKALIPEPQNGRDGRDGVDGKDGKDAEPVDLDALAVKAAALIDRPKDGRDADPVDLEAVAKAAAALIPTPADGKDATVDPDLLADMVATHVARAVASLEPPKDGTSVTVEDVAPLIAREVEKAVAALPVPKDGVGVVTMLQDRQGHLIVTLSDGQTKDVGQIAGRDVDMDAVLKAVEDTLASWPKPTNGIDGKDGMGFDDLSFAHDDHGRLLLKLQRGDVVKTVLVPCVVDRGVWRADEAYLKGDAVTWGGSVFIAQVDAPTTKPETSKEWRLAVKRGDKGTPGQNGHDGTPGRDGKDFTLPSPTKGRF